MRPVVFAVVATPRTPVVNGARLTRLHHIGDIQSRVRLGKSQGEILVYVFRTVLHIIQACQSLKVISAENRKLLKKSIYSPLCDGNVITC